MVAVKTTLAATGTLALTSATSFTTITTSTSEPATAVSTLTNPVAPPLPLATGSAPTEAMIARRREWCKENNSDRRRRSGWYESPDNYAGSIKYCVDFYLQEYKQNPTKAGWIEVAMDRSGGPPINREAPVKKQDLNASLSEEDPQSADDNEGVDNEGVDNEGVDNEGVDNEDEDNEDEDSEDEDSENDDSEDNDSEEEDDDDDEEIDDDTAKVAAALRDEYGFSNEELATLGLALLKDADGQDKFDAIISSVIGFPPKFGRPQFKHPYKHPLTQNPLRKHTSVESPSKLKGKQTQQHKEHEVELEPHHKPIKPHVHEEAHHEDEDEEGEEEGEEEEEDHH
ncbi:hypothetical protein CSAL01_07749 [Colletotrichum salicis]|uniref:Uncharacterized protein n=1 Tax=Colletotrichum salicis TaxID=1209931 RepID=A0A135V9K4_9PEZI|nr:hypothetical protein CSAL01_07749 [Colletotrichum salicis]